MSRLLHGASLKDDQSFSAVILRNLLRKATFSNGYEIFFEILAPFNIPKHFGIFHKTMFSKKIRHDSTT